MDLRRRLADIAIGATRFTRGVVRSHPVTSVMSTACWYSRGRQGFSEKARPPVTPTFANWFDGPAGQVLPHWGSEISKPLLPGEYAV